MRYLAKDLRANLPGSEPRRSAADGAEKNPAPGPASGPTDSLAKCPWHLLVLALGVAAAAPARASTLVEDVQALAGQWQGAEVAPTGHLAGTFGLTLTLAPAPATPTVAR